MFRILIILFAVLLVLQHVPANAGTADSWRTYIGPTRNGQQAVSDIWIGAQYAYQDGYDGQSEADLSGDGIAIAHRRDTGSSWSGPPGFYDNDYESPIPEGGSHIWSNIYLWAQRYPVPTHTANIVFGLENPPPGYSAHLVLEYVPGSLGWTGHMDFWLDLTQRSVVTLPVPEVSDGLLGTRMTLTVYTTPIPEPSSLLALGGGILGLAGLRRRRTSNIER